MAGYSGTSLGKEAWRQRGKPRRSRGCAPALLLPPRAVAGTSSFSSRITDVTDIVHVFSTRRAELQAMLSRYRQKLKPTGLVWVSWPKNAAKSATDITEDTIREIAFPLGFVDIMVCAIDELWSGLKLVIRKELR